MDCYLLPMAMPGYDPTTCDLCGSNSQRIILDMPDISMTSDDQVIERGLKKIECLDCKLIRSATPVSMDELNRHYGTQYQLGRKAALAEPLFFSEIGKSPRSKVIYDWFINGLSRIGFNPTSIMEIGCGEGSLLERFAKHPKASVVRGIDVNELSVARAQEKGLDVRRGNYRDVDGEYDLIYSFAVIEHVPSPSDFISALKSHLASSGVLLISQPSQDRGSSDIFFSDHLWHFYSYHIAKLGERQGLRETLRLADNKFIPNFSLHLFQRSESGNTSQPAGVTVRGIEETIDGWKKIFDGIDKWLNESSQLKLVVWGIGQTFTLFHTYTSLKHHIISLAIEDNPQRFRNGGLGFPVVRFDPRTFEDDYNLRVLFTFKPSNFQLRTLREMSISYYSPFEKEI